MLYHKKSPHCAVEDEGLNRFGYRWSLAHIRLSVCGVKPPVCWCWFNNPLMPNEHGRDI